MLKNIKFILILITIIIIVIAGTAIFFKFSETGKNFIGVNVQIDKTAILQKIQKVNRLQTVEAIFQRDLAIELDLGNFELFGKTLLENKRKQSFAVTGSVTAGVDLSKMDQNSIKVDSANKKIEITLPAPEIFSSDISADKLRVLRDEVSLLFKLETMNENRKNELNEKLMGQLIELSGRAMREAACTDNILQKANENAKEGMKNLFALTDFKEIQVNTTDPVQCL
jgi:hypothetical protein